MNAKFMHYLLYKTLLQSLKLSRNHKVSSSHSAASIWTAAVDYSEASITSHPVSESLCGTAYVVSPYGLSSQLYARLLSIFSILYTFYTFYFLFYTFILSILYFFLNPFHCSSSRTILEDANN